MTGLDSGLCIGNPNSQSAQITVVWNSLDGKQRTVKKILLQPLAKWMGVVRPELSIPSEKSTVGTLTITSLQPVVVSGACFTHDLSMIAGIDPFQSGLAP